MDYKGLNITIKELVKKFANEYKDWDNKKDFKDKKFDELYSIYKEKSNNYLAKIKPKIDNLQKEFNNILKNNGSIIKDFYSLNTFCTEDFAYYIRQNLYIMEKATEERKEIAKELKIIHDKLLNIYEEVELNTNQYEVNRILWLMEIEIYKQKRKLVKRYNELIDLKIKESLDDIIRV